MHGKNLLDESPVSIYEVHPGSWKNIRTAMTNRDTIIIETGTGTDRMWLIWDIHVELMELRSIRLTDPGVSGDWMLCTNLRYGT